MTPIFAKDYTAMSRAIIITGKMNGGKPVNTTGQATLSIVEFSNTVQLGFKASQSHGQIVKLFLDGIELTEDVAVGSGHLR